MQQTERSPNQAFVLQGEHHDAHYAPLQNAVPEWFGKATEARRQAFSRSRPRLADGLKNQPAAQHKKLQALNAQHWTAQNEVDRLLEKLQDAAGFAEPLLIDALRKKFDLANLDVRKTWLRLYIPIGNGAARTWTVSLLDAALHNFDNDEARDGAYEADSTFITEPDKSGRFQTLPSLKKKIGIPAFVRLCRDLDIGRQYQQHLAQVLGLNDPLTGAAMRSKIEESQKAAFKAALQFARMNKDVDEGYAVMIEGLLDGLEGLRLNRLPFHCYDLSILATALTGILVFAQDLDQTRDAVPVVVYIPDDPDHPVKQYASSIAFAAELTRQLRSPDYQQFFSRFVAHAQRGHFFGDLKRSLTELKFHPPVPGSGLPAWRETPVDTPNLHLRPSIISGDIWRHLYQSKLNKILNDARAIAVPTATVDQQARWAFWDSVMGIAETILNIASFIAMPFVPFLGEMMMAYMAWQMLNDTFEGILEWAQGQTMEAFDTLMGVAESLVQLGLFAVGGAVVVSEFRRVLPDKIVQFIDRFKAVPGPNGKTLYWKPDLTSYKHNITLSEASRPNRLGLHEHQGKQILPLEGEHFVVSQDPLTRTHRIEHPSRTDAYKPPLRCNGDGAWHTELEQPLAWDKETLLRRIGHSVDSLSPARREQVLEVSGYSEDALRKMHVEQEPTPPLLADTIKRFTIDQQVLEQNPGADPITRAGLFESRYSSMEHSDDPLVQNLLQADPQLPVSVAQALLDNATGTELLLIGEGQLPERLENLASVAKQEVHVTRAYEGLVLASVKNPETEVLALHSLEALPGWSADVRLEVRDVSYNGKLVDSIGRENAPIGKILVRQSSGGYDTYDSDGQQLHGTADLYRSVLQALPDAERDALKLNIGEDEKVRQRVRDNPLPRNELRTALAYPLIKEPVIDTLRLLGTEGYPRFAMEGEESPRTLDDRILEVYPNLTPEELEARRRQLVSHPDGPRAELTRLRDESFQLQHELQVWTNTPPTHHPASGAALTPLQTTAEIRNRREFSQEIRRAWRWENNSYDTEHGIELGHEIRFPHPLLGELPVLSGDFSHVVYMSLDIGPAARGINPFLERFPGLTSLEMDNLDLGGLPPAIADLSRLNGLKLKNCNLELNVESRATLSSLKHLKRLVLADNPRLTLAPDISNMPKLSWIDLANTGLTQIPDGLMHRGRLRIGYFQNNHLSVMPPWLFELSAEDAIGFSFAGNPLSVATREQIKVFFQRTDRFFEVLADQADIDQVKDLYPHLDNLEASDMFYQQPGTLAEGRITLTQKRAELDQLLADLHTWSTARVPTHHPATGVPLSAMEMMTEQGKRDQFKQKLEACWRQRPNGDVPEGAYGLASHEAIMGDLPILTASFEHICVLHLTSPRNFATTASHFLEYFPNLDELSIHGYQLADIPPAIFAMEDLTVLNLPECAITLTDASAQSLAGMSELVTLNLQENPLGRTPDLRDLDEMTLLNLSGTGITEVPPGLLEMENWLDIDLSNNAISEMPAQLMDVDPDNNMNFSNNPFTEESQARIARYFQRTGNNLGMDLAE